MNRLLPAVFLSIFYATNLLAQTDSVTVSGRILNLTPRLYRQSPNVLISRNNLLQADAELTRPAPLNPDGTYSVKMPLIFGQEEMYFSFASVSTAFLAAPGSITIDLNADSLFRAAVPFSFGGINARVNAQYARYKAFEAKQPKIDNEKLSRAVTGEKAATAFTKVRTTYYEPFSKFSRVETPFPLVKQWVLSANRYNAASYLYDMANFEGEAIPRALDDSLRPANDPVLTAARTVSVARMANWVNQYPTAANSSMPIRDITGLLLRYSRSLSEAERANLIKWQQANSARASDLRLMQRMIERNPDTLQRLMNYQMLINQARPLVDSMALQTLKAYWLAASLPRMTINRARLLYAFARPQLTDEQIIQSIDELYRLAVGDSTRIRQATAKLTNQSNLNTELSSGIFVTRDPNLSGLNLIDTWFKGNRSDLVYILFWSPSDEAAIRSATLAQRLRDLYPASQLSVLYVALPDDDYRGTAEYIVRQNLKGDHILPTLSQYEMLPARYGYSADARALLLDRTGKVIKSNMPLPDDFENLNKQLEKRLK